MSLLELARCRTDAGDLVWAEQLECRAAGVGDVPVRFQTLDGQKVEHLTARELGDANSGWEIVQLIDGPGAVRGMAPGDELSMKPAFVVVVVQRRTE